MTVLDKIKAFFKRPKPEAKGTEKKAVKPAETRATETPEKKAAKGSFDPGVAHESQGALNSKHQRG